MHTFATQKRQSTEYLLRIPGQGLPPHQCPEPQSKHAHMHTDLLQILKSELCLLSHVHCGGALGNGAPLLLRLLRPLWLGSMDAGAPAQGSAAQLHTCMLLRQLTSMGGCLAPAAQRSMSSAWHFKHGQLGSMTAGVLAHGGVTQHDNTSIVTWAAGQHVCWSACPRQGCTAHQQGRTLLAWLYRLRMTWTGNGPHQLCIAQGHICLLPVCPLLVAGGSCQQLHLAIINLLTITSSGNQEHCLSQCSQTHCHRTLLTWVWCCPAGAASWPGPSPAQHSACPWQPHFLQHPRWPAPETCVPGQQVSFACTPAAYGEFRDLAGRAPSRVLLQHCGPPERQVSRVDWPGKAS